jgi:hypothetical protein
MDDPTLVGQSGSEEEDGWDVWRKIAQKNFHLPGYDTK